MSIGNVWEMARFARSITLIGAGGKTTTLNTLTCEISAKGEKVVPTTTTKVFPVSIESVWENREAAPPDNIPHPCFWLGNKDETNGKWIGVSSEVLDREIFRDPNRVWVIEGDGARERSLKYWDTHEPQIPLLTECAVLILPSSLWGKRVIPELIHRPEFCQLIGCDWNNKIAWDYFLSSPVFYSTYKEMSWVILINEIEDNEGVLIEKINLDELRSEGKSFLAQGSNQSKLPQHLRLAAGNLREGQVRWCDL